VLRAWVQGRSLDTKRRRAEDFLPLAVREELPSLFGELELIGVSPHFLSDFLIPIKDNQLTPAALSQTLPVSRPSENGIGALERIPISILSLTQGVGSCRD
jgi:hypothetical protein